MRLAHRCISLCVSDGLHIPCQSATSPDRRPSRRLRRRNARLTKLDLLAALDKTLAALVAYVRVSVCLFEYTLQYDFEYGRVSRRFSVRAST